MDNVSPPPPLNPSPPSALSPPPVIAPTPSRPAKKGRGWMIFALVLVVLLGVSVLFNLGWFLNDVMRLRPSRGYAAGPRLEEVLTQDNGSGNKIAVVEVQGLISEFINQGGYNMVEVLKAQLQRAKADNRVKAVLLKVNSPGGEVMAADEIYRALEEFEQKSHKPIICSMGSLAASGGYYVSAPCRWIVANELTITGSIGVIMSTWNYRHLMDKVGVTPLVFKSGKFKDMLSGSKEPDQITDAEKEMIQSLINETFQRFKDIVADGRAQAYEKNRKQSVKLSDDWEDYADGRVLSGKEAYKLGFVDELGDFDVAVKRARKIAGVADANLVEYQQRIEFTDLFRFLGQSDAKAVKLDLGFELPKLEAGHLYFLSPTWMQ